MKKVFDVIIKCFRVSALIAVIGIVVSHGAYATHYYLCEDGIGTYYLDDDTIQYPHNRYYARVNIVAAHTSGYSRSFQIQLAYNDGTPFLWFIENGELSRMYIAHDMQWGVPAARWLVNHGYLKVK